MPYRVLLRPKCNRVCAVLLHLPGIETGDLVSLTTRSAQAPSPGARWIPGDDGKCTAIPARPEMDLKWKEYLYRPYLFEELFESDVYVYKAINASLDATIDQLGRSKVDRAARQLRWAQQQADQKCASAATFPCTAEGQKHPTTDCFVGDVGCGSECLDSVGKNLGSNPAFLQIT